LEFYEIQNKTADPQSKELYLIKGFIISEVNFESEHVGRPNP
jgi:hypothetical protein